MTAATIDAPPRRRLESPSATSTRGGWRAWVRRRPEVLVLAVAAAVGYSIAGWVMRYRYGYVVNDALARASKPLFMAVSRDPHFGAIGFYWPPLPSTLEIPFTIILEHFGHMDFAGPVSTALLTGISILVLHQICRELGLGRPVSFALCVLFAASPMIFVYAINGMSEACAYLCILLTMLGWLRWVRRRQAIDLALMGIALAALAMTRIEAGPMVIGLGLLAGANRNVKLWISRTLTVILPALFAIGVWLGTQWILLSDPLAFLHFASNTPNGSGFTAAYRAEYVLPSHGGYAAALVWAFRWLVVLTPLLLAALAVALARPRRHLYAVLGMVGSASVFPFVQVYLVDHQSGFGDPRYFTLMIPIGFAAAAYLIAMPRLAEPPPVFTERIRPVPAQRGSVVLALRAPAVLTALIATAVGTTAFLLTPHRTTIGNEDRVLRVLLGQRVRPLANDMVPAQRMDRYLDPYLAAGYKAIIDTNYAYDVDLFSHHPRAFIIPEDRDFLTTLEDPQGKFSFVVAPLDPNNIPVKDEMTPLVTPHNQWKQVGVYGDLVLYQSTSVPVLPG